MVNSNPETVSTDYDTSDILYFVANKAYLYKNDLGTDIEEAPIPSDMEEFCLNHEIFKYLV